MTRTYFTRWGGRTLATVGVLATMATALVGCADPTRRGDYRGVELTPARPKPDFTLTATDGRPFEFRRATDGQLTLLFFGYTYCPDICPVHLANIAAVLEKLPPLQRDSVRVVFVTTDPERDTPERLRSWLDNFGHNFVGLRGSVEDVNRIETSFGLPASIKEGTGDKYGVGHAAQVLAFTPDDSLRVLYPFGVRQQDWANDLPKLLAARARR
jgi:protein SCO1/2